MLSTLFIFACLLTACAYVLLINYILSYWDLTPPTLSKEVNSDLPSLSFVIPARNESENIEACLRSILSELKKTEQEIEIIVIDDHSEDDTYAKAQALNETRIKCIKLEDHINDKINAYKKAALNIGVRHASGEYIIQVDADCIIPAGYLKNLNKWVANYKPDMLVGMIHLTGESIFHDFQTLDMLGMMAVTGAGIKSKKWYMANGANLVYKKRSFDFHKNGLASGDDVYAIQKLAQEGANIIFWQEPQFAVATSAVDSINAFNSQRLRWATKNKLMTSYSMQLMMVIPFLISVLLCLGFIAFPFLSTLTKLIWGFLLLSKMGIDYIYLNKLSRDFSLKKKMKYFLASSLMHPIYLMIIGTLSLFIREYKWKGRKVK